MKEQQMSAPDYNIRVKTQSNEPEAQI